MRFILPRRDTLWAVYPSVQKLGGTNISQLGSYSTRACFMDTLQFLSNLKFNAFSQQGREGKGSSEPQSWQWHPLLLNSPSTVDKVMQLWGTPGAISGARWGHWRSPKAIYWGVASISRALCGTGIWWCLFSRAGCALPVLYNHTWWGWAKGTVNSEIIFHGLLYSPTGILSSDTEIIDKYKIRMYFLSKKEESQQKRHWTWSPSSHCFITYYNVPKQLLWLFK